MNRHRKLTISLVLILFSTASMCDSTSVRSMNCPDRIDPMVELGVYKQPSTIPAIGTAQGTYAGEISSGDTPNKLVDPHTLPKRPYLGTELYWEESDDQERGWFQELNLDFLRVEVTPRESVESRRSESLLPADFTQWSASDFERDHGWRFNHPDSTVTNILDNSYGVQFHLMMMMHYGGERYMGRVPDSDDYADYFLATVYYYNVIRGLGIKYWEVLNEPDWGYEKASISPEQYAAVFKRVAERIKSFPDERVSSIYLGGPALGSGDPVDGKWPDGYANRDGDGERQWRKYVPVLLDQGSRDGQCDVGFLSWHDYGSDTWKPDKSIYALDHLYALVNRVEAFAAMGKTYSGHNLPLVVSEFNLAAGETKADTKAYYKNFYAALWHTSALNNYFSSGKVTMLSPYRWKGDNHWPKAFVYQDNDSGNVLVRNTVWWAYREYIRHTQTRILAAYNGKLNPWADAVVTTDEDGRMFYLIAVNKSDEPQLIDFSFDVPEPLTGKVTVSKQIMQQQGDSSYGEAFAEPIITPIYDFQPLTLLGGKQIKYAEMILPRTIVYITVVSTSGEIQ